MKKFVIFLLSTCMLICVAMGLTACADDGCKHSYNEAVTNPTCTEQGYTTNTCEKCGDSFVDDYTGALNHSNRSWVGEIPAIDGVGDGVKGHFQCLDCGEKFDDQGNKLDNVVLHSFTEWIPAQPATCTSEGTVGFYFCRACYGFFDSDKNEILEENALIPTLAHTFSQWEDELSATCETLGHIAYGYCSTCEFAYDANGALIQNIEDVVIPYADHTFGNWIEEIAATCKDEGTLGHYYCSVCEKNFDDNEIEILSLTIPVNDIHAYGNWIEEIASTCKDEGTLGHYHCSVCEKNFDDNEDELLSLTIPVNDDHTYGDWIEEIASTCKVEGTLGHYHCAVCEKNFDDDKEILEDLAIPTEHKYELGNCIFCGEPKINNDLAFTLSEDETYYIVSGRGDCLDTYINIPSEHEGLPVEEIASSAFNDCVDLVSVSIPNTVKTIGASAFKYCDAIENVTISDGVETIEDQAFYGCHGLIQVSIPKSVTSIGSRSFDLCHGLTRIDVDSANTTYSSIEGVLYNKDATTLVRYPAGKAEQSFEVPSGVTAIGTYAFSYSQKLKELNIAKDVENIETYAFYVSKVRFVDFEENSSLTNIYASAFESSKLIKITIPENVTNIDRTAFYYCDTLVEVYNKSALDVEDTISYAKNIYTPESGESKLSITTDDYVLYTDADKVLLVGYIGNDTTLVLPSNVTEIGESAFNGSDLISVTIPQSVKRIWNDAFNNCGSMKELKLYATECVCSNGVLLWAGRYSGGVTVTVGANVKKLPDGIFYMPGTSNTYAYIKELIFEEGSVCTSIGARAFYDCNSLESIVLPDSIVEIGDQAFYGVNNSVYNEKDGLKYIGTVSNPYFYLVDARNMQTSDGIAEGCKIIGSEAFQWNTLEMVQIPEGVTSVGGGFSRYLKTIVLPKSVTEIQQEAFWDTYQLETVYYGGTTWDEYDAISTNDAMSRHYFERGCKSILL
ncbi:MAG: leucine-rich repeat domain-containing protein [Clostridia bacterium]|nr:leucine-rich repeat domain-containing protein [Clostridia bacterium]